MSGGKVNANYAVQPPNVRRDMEAQRMAPIVQAQKHAAMRALPTATNNAARARVQQQQQQRKQRDDRALQREITQQQSQAAIPLSEVLWGNPSWI
jgi:hypothetical protein